MEDAVNFIVADFHPGCTVGEMCLPAFNSRSIKASIVHAANSLLRRPDRRVVVTPSSGVRILRTSAWRVVSCTWWR